MKSQCPTGNAVDFPLKSSGKSTKSLIMAQGTITNCRLVLAGLLHVKNIGVVNMHHGSSIVKDPGRAAGGCGKAMVGCGCFLMLVPIMLFCLLALMALLTGGV